MRFAQMFSLLVFLFFTSMNLSASNFPDKKEADSVNFILNKCKADTCKFYVLSNLFWKYFFSESMKSPKAKFYGDWAYEIIKNSPNLGFRGDGFDIKGNLLINHEKPDSGMYYKQKALELFKAAHKWNRVAWCYFTLGELSSTFGDSKITIEYFKMALKYFGIKDNYREIYRSNIYIAASYERLGILDSLLAYNLKNLILAKTSGNKKDEINALLELSYYYQRCNNIKKSVEYLSNSLSEAEKLKNDNILIDSYLYVGSFFFKQRKNNEIALVYFNKALGLAKTINNTERIATLLNEIAIIYLETNQSKLALWCNLQSLELSKKLDASFLIDAYSNLGYTYKKMGDYDAALKNFQMCWQKGYDNYRSALMLHGVLIEIGDIYFKNNNIHEALLWYNKALEISETSKSKIEMAISSCRIGDFYLKLNKPSLSEVQYLKAMRLALEVKSITLIKDIADTLSNFYSERSNYKSANYYLKLARSMSDSLAITERQSSMANLEMKFEFDRIKKENDDNRIKSNEKIKKQRIILLFLMLVSVLLTLLGVVIYLSYRRKNNDNIQLALQKTEIERISKQLHDTDQLKLKFFTNISHELRTPLTLIISPLTNLFKSLTEEKSKGVLSVALANARRLQSLINQLLDISKLDKGEMKLCLKFCDFNKHIRVISSMFQSMADEKKIDFKIIVKNKQIKFCYDPERISQVINNLLSNAFKFTQEHGKIILKIDVLKSNEYPDFVQIQIRDTGIGIPPESINKIFERFYQVDSTITRNFEGSGIGLSLAKEFVELHDGKISAESEPGKWTEFKVLLPMKLDNSEILQDDIYFSFLSYYQSNTGKTSNMHNLNRTRSTILIIEDNSDLRSYLLNILSENFNVLEATNGSEGIKTAIQKIPDIIISDIMMPVTDGYQLTSVLKEKLETCHIPIILLTAKSGHESKLEGLKKGADDYLPKPFDEEELLLKIKNLLLNRQILQQKFRKQISVTPSDIDVKTQDEKFIIKLTTLIESQLSNKDLNINYISTEIGMSQAQLYRKLKNLTDLSINHFIRSIRLKRAAQLLQKKSGTVSEIAYMTGFETPSYFTKKFKNEYGVLPSEYC